MSELTTRHYYIYGVVQGVCYRDFTYKQAVSLKITGWARNRLDGSVEVLASGSKDNLNQFEKKLHRGPMLAHVNDIKSKDEELNTSYDSFTIKATR